MAFKPPPAILQRVLRFKALKHEQGGKLSLWGTPGVLNTNITESYLQRLIEKVYGEKECMSIFYTLGVFQGRDAFRMISQRFGYAKTIPDKKKLLELSQRNARHYQLEQRKQKEAVSTESRTERILQKIKEDLRLTDFPVHIECFDNSNIQGKEPVASCVVFRNTRPSKNEYRHFHIKTVTGANDYASMEEVITRRYTRLLNENKGLPQLVLIDGGKGQLSAAVSSLDKLGLRGKIAAIGIAKKLEEIYFPGDSVPLYIDKNSETLKVLQNLRNEAHRFGIAFHRNQRSKKMTLSVLDQIDGIGEKTKEKLLTRYHSIENILKEDPANLYQEIGKQRTERLLEYLDRTNKPAE